MIEKFTYRPGICNIDSVGVRWRKRLGIISLATGVISMIVLYVFHFGPAFRFIIGSGFGFMTALNFLQASEHFCIMNARGRTFETSLKRNGIKDDSEKEKDMKKMRSMIGKSLIYALLGGFAALLPF